MLTGKSLGNFLALDIFGLVCVSIPGDLKYSKWTY